MRRVVILIVIVGLALTASLFVRTSTAQAQSHADRKVINRIAPVYPELAKRMHMSGVVKLETVIRADGNVKSTKALGGSPVLIEAAMDAVRKWKFEAASEESTEIIQVAFEPR
jgi:TonB family protein